MMKENDIRIGNWVSHNGNWSYRNDEKNPVDNKPFNFQWESSDWYALGECTLFIEDVSPIPLTKDILGKCLTKVSDKEFKIEIPYEWSHGNDHTDYWFYVKWYEYYATGESHTGWRPWIKEGKDKDPTEIFLWGYLESVHQLQNFYYALTKMELPVKL